MSHTHLLTISLLMAAFIHPSFAWAACQIPIAPEKELVITDLSVVNDPRATTPNGPWTFGHLIRQMAPPKVNPPEFLARWLTQWITVTSVNSFPVEPRPNINSLLKVWPKLQNGQLDLDKAPVRLLAIVNRSDVQMNSEFGEGRFVFGILDDHGNPTQFTLIFEYDYPKAALPRTLRTDGRIAWAKAWHQLGALNFGPEYNNARKNHAHLRQPRGQSRWDQRQFNIANSLQ